jgi:hypothetical protein
MATIRKRKSGWNVQVRRMGYAPRSKTFRTKPEAQAWARQQEVLMDARMLICTES